MTPTPTDPRDREIRQLRAYLDEIGMAALGAQPESPTGPGVLKVVQSLKADHSKLAAEIAELKRGGRCECRFAESPIEYHQGFKVEPGAGQMIWTNRCALHAVQVEKETATLRAELEAARKEREDETRENEMLRAYAGSQMFYSDFQTADDMRKALNTARAAKDAAEKERDTWERSSIAWQDNHAKALERVDALWEELTAQRRLENWVIQLRGRGYINAADSLIGGFLADIDKARALTPAPTQEPPAGGNLWQPISTAPDDGTEVILGWEKLVCSGHWDEKLNAWVTSHGTYRGSFNPIYWQPLPPAGGVTISTEKKGGDEPCAPHTSNAPACSESTKVPIQTALSTAPGASNSPADVPSEGRGELLPFNLSDALAGKPVVTRDGRRVTRIKDEDVDGCQVLLAVVDGCEDSHTLDGSYLYSGEAHPRDLFMHPRDLFMLPPEGSGA